LAWLDNNYLFRKKITIESDEVTANLTGFPAVYHETDVDLKKALANGFDFKVTEGETTEVPYERNFWDDATGEILLWIKTNPNASTDTDYFLYYGFAGETVDQADPEAVWDSNYRAVYHMGDADTPLLDSTSNDFDLDESGDPVYQQSGQIKFAVDYDGNGDDHRSGTEVWDGVGPFTAEIWFKTTQSNSPNLIVQRVTPAGTQLTGLWVMRLNGDELSNLVRNTSNELVDISTTVGSLNDGNWHYGVISRDGSDNIYVRVDGGNEISSSRSGTLASAGLELRLASYLNDNAERLDGELTEGRVSDTYRNNDWTDTSFNNQTAPSTFWITGAEEDVPLGFSQAQIIG